MAVNPRTSEAAQVSSKQASGSVLHLLDVIEVLAAQHGSLPLKDIAAQVNRSPSSVLRLVRSLELRGYVTSRNGAYRLSLKFAYIGSRVVAGLDIAEEAAPACERLRDEVNETIQVAVRSDTDIVYVARFESQRPMRITSHVGLRLPLHCTALGKSTLAYVDASLRQDLLGRLDFKRQTEHTIADRRAFERELEATRARGWSIDRQEFDESLVCVAAPILGGPEGVVAALSLTAPPDRMDEPTIVRFGDLVRSTADEISARLGHNPETAAQGGTDE